jgi:hypothetical protein
MSAHVCTCLHMSAHGCTCLHMSAHVCTCLHMSAHGCTCLHMSAHVCTWLDDINFCLKYCGVVSKLKLSSFLVPYHCAPVEPSVYQTSLPFLTRLKLSSHLLLAGNLTMKSLSQTCIGIILSVPICRMSYSFIPQKLYSLYSLCLGFHGTLQ